MSLFNVSVSPHITSPATTRGIMGDMLIALTPAAIAGAVLFGARALLVEVFCVAVCVLAELAFNFICKKPVSVGDLSAAVTGLLLALNLPVSIPLWQAAAGCVFAIVIIKGLFGGIGQNFANPAISARVFMLISFSGAMAKADFPMDTVAGATPLGMIGQPGAPLPSLADMFLGIRGGALGETCAVALLVGGIYLLCRRVITWHTPVSYMLTVFLLAFALTGSFSEALYHLLAGGLIIGAIFMATDYSTTPLTYWGKVVFGVGCGLLTVLIRFFSSYPEGVSFSILLMNILTPYIDKWTAKKPFGGVRHEKSAA